MQRTKSKILSILLSLVMLLSLLPTTALAASYPDAASVSVDGNKYFGEPGSYYFRNGGSACSKDPTGYNAYYNPTTGTLTLDGYNGGSITAGGVECSDITVVLKGTNTINGSLTSDVGGDIAITSESGGTLSITNTLSGGNAAIGIETGLSASNTTGNVTIKGNAKVTIDMTHNGTSTYEKAYGIYAKENITISENASMDITCATPNNTTGGDRCNGLYAAKDVTIDTNGTIKIDVTKAGKDDGYSFGVYPMGKATLTKVGNMEVQWKKHATHSSYPGGVVYKGASLSDTDYAINVDETNCYASYRKGTPYTVTVEYGTLAGTGVVSHANNNGNFLAGDTVEIKPSVMKGKSGEVIPFKEWTPSDVAFTSPATTASNSFTVPGKDVTVTAKHSPFDGTPTFTPIGTTGTEGTLTFTTVVDPYDGSEGFYLVKEADVDTTSKYISINPSKTSTGSPYEYSSTVNFNNFPAGNYYVAEKLNGAWYLSEKFTVSYTVPVTTYTVSFDANGGTGTMADVTNISGNYTLPDNGFTAPEGQRFKAWSVGGVEKAAGDTITVNANTTVTAIWEPIPVTKPAVTTTTLPDGKVGDAYSQTLAATGTNPIAWSIETGNLPDGLTLVGDTIKGTPSKAGDFKFTVKATNGGGSDTKELTIKIADAEASKYHNVTLSGAGTGATGAGSHAAGTTVNIYAGTKSGYTFNGWTSDDVTVLSASSKNASFVMRDKDVTVKANWVYTGGGSTGGGYTYYTIKATAGVNGSISPTGNVSVREGRDQTFTITPNKGYAVAKVLIDSKNVGAVKSYTFENVKKNHTIEVVFMKASGNPQTGVFVDVPEGSYYEEAVNWAVEKGITTGTDATHFSPDGICTRAQAVTFLWRAAGSPAAKSAVMPFTDVKAGSYYYDAVLWAVENGITKGTSDTMFSPDATCSRAQIVTFLWRSQKSPAAGTANPFTDVKASAYYADAVLWAVKEDVTKGTTNTTFSPDANCTRAQIVTFIWRALAE